MFLRIRSLLFQRYVFLHGSLSFWALILLCFFRWHILFSSSKGWGYGGDPRSFAVGVIPVWDLTWCCLSVASCPCLECLVKSAVIYASYSGRRLIALLVLIFFSLYAIIKQVLSVVIAIDFIAVVNSVREKSGGAWFQGARVNDWICCRPLPWQVRLHGRSPNLLIKDSSFLVLREDRTGLFFSRGLSSGAPCSAGFLSLSFHWFGHSIHHDVLDLNLTQTIRASSVVAFSDLHQLPGIKGTHNIYSFTWITFQITQAMLKLLFETNSTRSACWIYRYRKPCFINLMLTRLSRKLYICLQHLKIIELFT